MSEPVIAADLRRLTPARVGLGRSGTGLPTAELLQFAADHAIAREAVHATWDVAGARADLAERGWPSRTVATQVSDRALYLRRPDLGRRLAPADRESLAAIAGSADVALVLSDGLSATAAERHGPSLVADLADRLVDRGLTVALVVAPFARVGLLDDVGDALRARAALIVIGERPGLSAPDNLSIYFEVAPKLGRTDADRNCLSNIRPGAFAPDAAAAAAVELLLRGLELGVSGTALKAAGPQPNLGT